MKAASIINFIVVIAPILFGLLGLTDEEYLIHAALASIVTGAVQVIIALFMLSKHSSNLLYIYFAITGLFFILWEFLGTNFYIFALPPALALYLTYIIYIERQKEKALPPKA